MKEKKTSRTKTVNACGAVRTGGGAVRAGGGAVRTGGGAVRAASGAVRTGGGAVRTDGGAVRAASGAVRADGGAVRAKRKKTRGANGTSVQMKHLLNQPHRGPHWSERILKTFFGSMTESDRIKLRAELSSENTSRNGSRPNLAKTQYREWEAMQLLKGVGILLFIALLSTFAISLSPLFVMAYCKHRSNRLYQRERYRKIRQQTAESRMRRHRYSAEEPPTPERLLDAWVRSRRSAEEALAFGSLLLSLEASLRNDPIRDGERIVGRNGGIRRWLSVNCPEIGYKTAMRYKSMADKYRKMLNIPAHRPVSWYLPSSSVPVSTMRTTLHAYEKRARSINSWIAAEAARDAKDIQSETEESVARCRRQGATAFERQPFAPFGVDADGFEGASRRITESLHLVRDFCGGPVLHKTNREKPANSPRRELYASLFRKHFPDDESPSHDLIPDSSVARIMIERHLQHILAARPGVRTFSANVPDSKSFHV